MALADVRPKLAAVLAPVGPDDPPVIDFPDAIPGRCYQLGYGFPWLSPMGQGVCNWRCRTMVSCIAGRLDQVAGLDDLEDMTAEALRRLQADATQWPVEVVSVPEGIEFANVAYLGARITLLPIVSLGGS